MNHDYAGCQVAPCPLCEAYGDGYAAGKAKAFEEVRARAQAWQSAPHADDCGCEPCISVRTVISFLEAHREGVQARSGPCGACGCASTRECGGPSYVAGPDAGDCGHLVDGEIAC